MLIEHEQYYTVVREKGLNVSYYSHREGWTSDPLRASLVSRSTAKLIESQSRDASLVMVKPVVTELNRGRAPYGGRRREVPHSEPRPEGKPWKCPDCGATVNLPSKETHPGQWEDILFDHFYDSEAHQEEGASRDEIKRVAISQAASAAGGLKEAKGGVTHSGTVAHVPSGGNKWQCDLCGFITKRSQPKSLAEMQDHLKTAHGITPKFDEPYSMVAEGDVNSMWREVKQMVEGDTRRWTAVIAFPEDGEDAMEEVDIEVPATMNSMAARRELITKLNRDYDKGWIIKDFRKVG